MRGEHNELPPVTEIAPGLFLGGFDASKNVRVLMKHNITAMVSVSSVRARDWDGPGHRTLIAEKDHLFVHCEDKPTEDLLTRLPDICDFIEARLHPKPPSLEELLQMSDASAFFRGHNVLVHCYLGVSRSATVVAAYLMRKRHQGRDEVLHSMKTKRRVNPNQSFLGQLKVWEEVDYYLWEDRERKVAKGLYQLFLQQMALKKVRISQQRLEPWDGW
jgi:protein-tyrosine phosphatase